MDAISGSNDAVTLVVHRILLSLIGIPDIAGDCILVPVGKTILSTTGMFILNEMAEFIWDILPQINAESEILEAVLKEYDVSAEEAAQDISEFLDELRRMEII